MCLIILLFIQISVGEVRVGERKAIDYEDRRIVVILDNNHSKLRAKTIAYSVTVGEVDDVAEMRGTVRRTFEDFVCLSLFFSLLLYFFLSFFLPFFLTFFSSILLSFFLSFFLSFLICFFLSLIFNLGNSLLCF